MCVARHPDAEAVHLRQGILGVGEPTGGRLLEELRGSSDVALDAAATEKGQAGIILRLYMPFIGRRQPQAQRVCRVALDAAAGRVNQRQIVLGRGNTLLDRLLIPDDGLGHVLWDPGVALLVERPESVLRLTVTLIGQSQPDLLGTRRIVRAKRGQTVLKGLRCREGCRLQQHSQRQQEAAEEAVWGQSGNSHHTNAHSDRE